MTTRIHAQIISKVTVDRQLAFHGSICNVYSEKKTSHNPRELNVLEKKTLDSLHFENFLDAGQNRRFVASIWSFDDHFFKMYDGSFSPDF